MKVKAQFIILQPLNRNLQFEKSVKVFAFYFALSQIGSQIKTYYRVYTEVWRFTY